MNPFRLIAALALLGCSALADETAEKLLSKAPDRDAKVIGETPKDGDPSISLLSEGEVIWKHTLTWGYPVSSVVSWSPHSTMVAIAVHTAKTRSEVHVFDVWNTKKEIKIPDLAVVALALVGGVKGRFLHVTPAGWSGEENLLVEATGNLVDWGTDGNPARNYTYVFTVNIPTGRVLSAVCTSQHILNSEQVKMPLDGEKR
jgi:hypothetical protein